MEKLILQPAAVALDMWEFFDSKTIFIILKLVPNFSNNRDAKSLKLIYQKSR